MSPVQIVCRFMVTYIKIFKGVTFNLKVVNHLKSASEGSYDVINMATINRNCSLKLFTISTLIAGSPSTDGQ